MDIFNVWKEKIMSVPKANLYGADLYGTNLRGADLYGADLYGADLRDADLRGADLYGADLLGANLCGADLREADLRRANLTGVNLTGANLTGANLTGADLREVLGNSQELKSMQVETYIIVYSSTHIQIGCERHTIKNGQSLTTDVFYKWKVKRRWSGGVSGKNGSFKPSRCRLQRGLKND